MPKEGTNTNSSYCLCLININSSVIARATRCDQHKRIPCQIYANIIQMLGKQTVLQWKFGYKFPFLSLTQEMRIK